ncbi:T9SS type B sorting domain-containing protein [Flavobacterium cellulosilyticum]|uniref:T9SS type B sorting domain-containing protein n=1 Tax=Flavobacterium cellulosilyticum TaxID=2541731 RepID=A0A4R5CJS3_9FLAO|nr:T9SS type B sorting domain-containing protein [Flavobacterium cellulosilyticum]TDD98603.1 T9SS type B sorting domain-containing protein [Flavobacterium cellulosilyticum]
MKNIILFLFIALSCSAQFSKTHYIPPLTTQNNLAEDQYLYISTPNTNDVNFKIIEIGGAIISGVVSNSVPYIHRIGQGNTSQLFTPKTTIGIIQNKGFIIEAEDLVYVSVRINSGANNNGGYNHAGGLVSKGNSALGKSFRLGAMLNPNVDNNLLNFASILSTENNTKVTLSNIPIGTIFTDGTIYTAPITVTLNKNESYVMGLENYSGNNTPSNSSKMIGALVESDKPVVVNAGSIGGSNSTSTNGRDIGFDQIVSSEKIGKEYIFVKGIGTDDLEKVLLIANTPNTIIYINGVSTPYASLLNAGDYAIIDGSKYINGNLYVNTSENVFAYQSIGGLAPAILPNGNSNNPPANQNLFFVPPLNCATPNSVDNIPLIESIGNNTFNGGLNIVTETGALVKINGVNTTAPAIAISGNPGFVRYTINNLSGNIAVKSTKQVYVSYFGTNGAATYGGYYSGFDIKPEIVSDKISVVNSACIPNVVLKINSLSSYDTFKWYKNDVEIPGAISNQYTPTSPGYYQVRGNISGCPSNGFVFSDKIPISECPTNIDNDKANDNIDIDNDNDGITNCTESYGNQNIDISNTSLGTIAVGNYTNSFLGTISTSGTGLPTGTFTGKSDGTFVSEIPAGKGNSITYKMIFNQPISLGIDYSTTSTTSDLLNPNAQYIIRTDINKTITVLNPTNQLLIDTNYDGIYETGVTEYSSFEIRFILNSTTPLSAGTGTFKFLSYLTNSISFTHSNLSDTLPNKTSLALFATCVPKDSDNDGISDQLDQDTDNDGIPDGIEAQVNNSVVLTNVDSNKNGLDNAFEPGLTPIDTDNDGIPDYLDLDSDNDGILDAVETGIDTDADGIRNYRDLESDNDLCSDVIEAGFLDANGDGILGGIAPPMVDANGLVTSAIGYTTPNSNYITYAPIVITTQPNVAQTCELQNATITLKDNGGNTYQWQLSIDSINWIDINDNTTYSGTTSNTLTIMSITNAMNGYKYRVQLNKIGNSCGLLSSDTTLKIYVLPIVNDIKITQCDDDLDAITSFNLTVNNNMISSKIANETITYYTTLAGATTANPSALISNPLDFVNTTPGTMPVWARVMNSNGCFSIAKLTLNVVATNIPSTYSIIVPPVCDDFLDSNGNNNSNNNKRDGIATFDFSYTKTTIENLLPKTAAVYSIRYYRNQADALAELNDITTTSNYRNIGYPNSQNIWVRVDSDADNTCYGLGPFVTLTVEKLPFANPVIISRQCDDDHDGKFPFNTSALEANLLNGQTNISVTYFDQANNPLPSPFPASFLTASQTIKAVVSNNTSLKCLDQTTIQFIVDNLPEAFSVPVSLTTTCDDELDPLLQDGKFAFDSATFQTTILNGQTGMTVKYFDQNGNILPSPLPNPYVTATQNVKVVVENPINTTCKVSVIIPFKVLPVPKIKLNINGSEDKLVCQNDPTFYVKLDAGIQDGSPTTNYTYIWSKDGTVLSGKTSYTLDVNAEGNYSVEVSTLSGCSRIRTIKVTASDVAHIDNIQIVDMTDINTVTANVSGLGDYEYSLDEASGYFQDSNFFTNVPAGIHEVYINDKNGCGPVVHKTIAVIGVPKFFTPNNDGYNDYWSPKGVNAVFNSKSTIYIYDRFGKLLKQLIPSNQEGWDGTFNGFQLPSDDYWYTVKLEDGREAKGHFSLKR